MGLIAILKNVGKDLSHVTPWIEEGLSVATTICGVVDPPLVPIFTAVENLLNGIADPTKVTAAQVQAIVTAVSLVESLESVAPHPPANQNRLQVPVFAVQAATI